jgi:hypothetical protein
VVANKLDPGKATYELKTNLTATDMPRRYHNVHRCPLLQLPDDVLGVIAHLMGKQATILCSKMRQVRRSPVGLCLPFAEIPSTQPASSLPGPTIPYLSVLRSWPLPVTKLVLGDGIILDGPLCRVIAEALPSLSELTCTEVDPARNCTSAFQLTALTSMHATAAAHDLRALVASAPQLRSLKILRHNASEAPPTKDSVWGPLAYLSNLEELVVPLRSVHLAAFPSAMRHLTGLTHLGLNLFCRPLQGIGHLLGDARRFVDALAALPLLTSAYISGFAMLAPFLAPALQAMTALRRLGLEGRYWWDGGEAAAHPIPILAGRLPDVSAMPRLECLALHGQGVVSPANMQQLCSAGSDTLRELRLSGGDFAHLPSVCAALQRLSALTGLVLHSEEAYSSGGMPLHHEELLSGALSMLTQLQNVNIHGDIGAFTPWLASLHRPTSLKLCYVQGGLQEADLLALTCLTSLRRLLLVGDLDLGMCRRLCMAAVRQLPLLEVLELGRAEWTEEEVRVLAPPPERLQRVVLYIPYAAATTPWDGLAAIELLGRFGVEVVVSGEAIPLWPCYTAG